MLAQDDALGREHVLVGTQVERLGIGEDAVEIEDDRAQRHYVFGFFSFSPARIGTFNRFSEGGIGHS